MSATARTDRDPRPDDCIAWLDFLRGVPGAEHVSERALRAAASNASSLQLAVDRTRPVGYDPRLVEAARVARGDAA